MKYAILNGKLFTDIFYPDALFLFFREPGFFETLELDKNGSFSWRKSTVKKTEQNIFNVRNQKKCNVKFDEIASSEARGLQY